MPDVYTQGRSGAHGRGRTQTLIVRLTPAEKVALATAARAAHLTVSDYCRERLLRPGRDVVAECGRWRAIAEEASRAAAEADRRALAAAALGHS